MISLIVPSRGRPERLKAMWESALETAGGKIELLLYLDEDDPALLDYPFSSWRVIGPRCVLSEAWNQAARASQGTMLMMAGDDLIFRTKYWDLKAKAALSNYPDTIALIHTNDGFQNEALCTHPIVSRTWYEAVGMLCPPYFTADYNDVWLHEVADRLGRRVYLPDVLIEHIHPDAGKIAMDRTYIEQRQRRVNDHMPELYEHLLPERLEWVKTLRRKMWALEPTDS